MYCSLQLFYICREYLNESWGVEGRGIQRFILFNVFVNTLEMVASIRKKFYTYLKYIEYPKQHILFVFTEDSVSQLLFVLSVPLGFTHMCQSIYRLDSLVSEFGCAGKGACCQLVVYFVNIFNTF